jgi:hypothetical protein
MSETKIKSLLSTFVMGCQLGLYGLVCTVAAASRAKVRALGLFKEGESVR